MRSLVFRLLVVSAVTLLGGAAGHGQVSSATITFDNRSGEPAVVKLIGPSAQTSEVPNGETRTVNAGAGQYHIVTRYGVGPGRYTYVRGDPFQVTQPLSQRLVITITLHKVVNGNYGSHPTSAEEFDGLGTVTAPAAQKGVIEEAKAGNLLRVKALLAAKADVNAKSADGKTALIVASENGQLEVVKACSVRKPM